MLSQVRFEPIVVVLRGDCRMAGTSKTVAGFLLGLLPTSGRARRTQAPAPAPGDINAMNSLARAPAQAASLPQPIFPAFSTHPYPYHALVGQNISLPTAGPCIPPPELSAILDPATAFNPGASLDSRAIYTLLVMFHASMYFSMQADRQAVSSRERELEAWEWMQWLKQFSFTFWIRYFAF